MELDKIEAAKTTNIRTAEKPDDDDAIKTSEKARKLATGWFCV